MVVHGIDDHPPQKFWIDRPNMGWVGDRNFKKAYKCFPFQNFTITISRFYNNFVMPWSCNYKIKI